MANRYATKAGNWSDVTVWDGGATLPQSGDTVRPNNFAVTIDQDVTVTELRNDASAPAAAGGTFVVSSIPGGGRTITAAITNRAAVDFVIVSASSGTVNFVGLITGTNSGTSGTSGAILLSGGGTLDVNITGNVVAVGANMSGVTSAVRISATVVLDVIGNLTGTALGGANGTHCSIYISAGSPVVNVTGDVTPGTVTSAGSAIGIGVNGGNATITVTGNLNGCPAAAGDDGFNYAVGFIAAGTSSVTVNGNVVGAGATGTSPTILVGHSSAVVTVTVNGAVTATTGVGVRQSAGTMTLTVTGTCTAAAAAAVSVSATTVTATLGNLVASTSANAALFSSGISTTSVRVLGTLTDASNGFNAISSPRWVVDNSPAVARWTKRSDSAWPNAGTVVTLSTSSTNGMPDEDDVRSGEVYGPSNSLTGTAHATLTAAEVWDVLLADIDTPGSIGERVKNAATVPAVGALLAAALHREA